eukprot:176513-Lingulodinium_polyedra.AAC.1
MANDLGNFPSPGSRTSRGDNQCNGLRPFAAPGVMAPTRACPWPTVLGTCLRRPKDATTTQNQIIKI